MHSHPPRRTCNPAEAGTPRGLLFAGKSKTDSRIPWCICVCVHARVSIQIDGDRKCDEEEGSEQCVCPYVYVYVSKRGSDLVSDCVYVCSHQDMRSGDEEE